MGPNSSEANYVQLPDTCPYRSVAGYNDFDDYNGYIRTVNTPTVKGFTVKCTVYYVQSNNLDEKTNDETYYKRLVIAVAPPLYLSTDTLYFSDINDLLVMPILDVIQSYIIKGVIILVIMQTMVLLQKTLYEQTERSIIEQEMFSVSSIFSSDIRCVGSDNVSVQTLFFNGWCKNNNFHNCRFNQFVLQYKSVITYQIQEQTLS